jgi:hypothetical protein
MMIMCLKGFNYNVCFQYNVVSVPYNIDCILCMYMVENKFFKREGRIDYESPRVEKASQLYNTVEMRRSVEF